MEPIHIWRIQVVEFQECSNYKRQDSMATWPYMDMVTHYIFSHMCNDLKLSTGNYHVWFCSKSTEIKCNENAVF